MFFFVERGYHRCYPMEITGPRGLFNWGDSLTHALLLALLFLMWHKWYRDHDAFDMRVATTTTTTTVSENEPHPPAVLSPSAAAIIPPPHPPPVPTLPPPVIASSYSPDPVPATTLLDNLRHLYPAPTAPTAA